MGVLILMWHGTRGHCNRDTAAQTGRDRPLTSEQKGWQDRQGRQGRQGPVVHGRAADEHYSVHSKRPPCLPRLMAGGSVHYSVQPIRHLKRPWVIPETV